MRCWYGGLLDRIVVDEGVMCGKPVINGTRITVEAIICRLAEGLKYRGGFRGFSSVN